MDEWIYFRTLEFAIDWGLRFVLIYSDNKMSLVQNFHFSSENVTITLYIIPITNQKITSS